MKVALVHDFLTDFGEKEEVLLELSRMFPEAPIYTFLYDEAKLWDYFPPQKVRVSFLQKLPDFLKQRFNWLLFFLPIAPETFDLREFDLVISSSSGFAKGVVTRPKTVHLCYCHNPSVFIWEQRGFFWQNYLRIWDKSSSRRVDHFAANSKDTAQRIAKYYRREAKIIFPPVPPVIQEPAPVRDYFLIVSPLLPENKIDIAVLAFNKLDLPLVIAGEGPQEERLRELAGSKIKFVRGGQADAYYKNCRALVIPGPADFGSPAIKAMSFGKPVLAPAQRGMLDTVLPGMTGELFEDFCAESLADGVRRLRANYSSYSPFVIKKWAERFSAGRFRRELMELARKLGYNKEDAYRTSQNLELLDRQRQTK